MGNSVAFTDIKQIRLFKDPLDFEKHQLFVNVKCFILTILYIILYLILYINCFGYL